MNQIYKFFFVYTVYIYFNLKKIGKNLYLIDYIIY